MTTNDKIAAFELLIERMKESECSGMCRALMSLGVYGKIETDAVVYVAGVIKDELKKLKKRTDGFLFTPYSIPPRVAWCKAQIAALKA